MGSWRARGRSSLELIALPNSSLEPWKNTRMLRDGPGQLGVLERYCRRQSHMHGEIGARKLPLQSGNCNP